MKEERYHHENLKDDLIDMGIKILDTEGYDNLSLRKVAKACGVSHNAPYRHFRDKEELITAIAAKVLHQFNETLMTAIAKYPDDVRSQINEMGCAYVQFFVENPSYLRLIFFSDICRRTYEKLENSYIPLEKPENTFYDTINRYIIEKRANNPSDILKNKSIALGAWGLVHGITVLLVQGEFPYEGDYMEIVREIIWKSIL